MTIEYVPRSRREEDGWRDHGSAEDRAASAKVPISTLDEVDGETGVRVSVQRRGFATPRIVLRPWIFLVLLFNGGNILRGVFSGRNHLGWSVWASILLVLVILAVVYRALRLHRFSGRDRLDLLLTPVGIQTRGLVVPWSNVTDVVRFNFLFGPGPGGPGPRNFLAVRVDDFLSVRGLTPFRAGLANLTRRHLVVLALTTELRDARALATALEMYAANPERRAELATPEGLRRVQFGS